MRHPRPIARCAARCAARLVAGLLLVLGAERAAAQERTPGTLSPVVAREAAGVYNTPTTLRVLGAYDVPADEEVDGDLAVIEGPVSIAGRVRGRVVVINANLALNAGARVGRDVLVIGGTMDMSPDAVVEGTIRVLPDSLRYREEGDRIVPLLSDTTLVDLWARFRASQQREGLRLSLSTGGTYNRTEGLALVGGPAYRRYFGSRQLDVEALGIVRSPDFFHLDEANLGYRVRVEGRSGGRRGVTVGGTLYDLVNMVEGWQLDSLEIGLASFLLHRDYADYYDARGAGVYVGAFTGADADVRLGLRREHWGSRQVRDPFTLFRGGEPWRDMPPADEGRFDLATAALRVDTRNNVSDPWSGWYLTLDYEYGRGDVTSFAPLSPGVRDTTDRRVGYGRGFLDVRRYNRISRKGQLNLRLLLGGYLHGDPLPAQRRLSVGGAGSMPGLDFRRTIGETDASQCAMGPVADVPAGTPAQCDRLALAQVEYRRDIRLGLGGDLVIGRVRRWVRDAQWVVFADAGRGWLVGERQGELRYPRGELPALGTFRTDVGAGIDVGPLGLYLAKSLSRPSQDLNFLIRLQRRF